MNRSRMALWVFSGSFVTFCLLVGFVPPAKAEPSWARKYNANCTLCHTIYPRLNRTGYLFKRLGYRFPSELVKEMNRNQPPNVSKEIPVAAPSQELIYVPANWSESAAAGKALIEKFNCATCHQIVGTGGRIGPSLDGVGGRRSREFIRDHISDPVQHASQYSAEFQRGGELMPKVPASPQEVDQMAAYLLTLSYRSAATPVPHPASTGIPEMNPAYVPAEMTPSAAEGKKLYTDAGCLSCHSISGSGGDVGPAMDGVGTRRSPMWLVRHITNPEKHIATQPEVHETKTSMMPPTELTPIEIAKIVDYLLTLPSTTQQKRASIPRNKLQDYFGIAYLPAVEMERSADGSNNTFVSRELNVYIAGTLGPNFSLFVQPLPATDAPGFLNHFEMMEGLFNYGGKDNFVQVRYGQILNLLNAGFAGTDRTITKTIPLIFESANGFNPAELGRGVSVEFTTKGLTTFKVFGNYQTTPELEATEAGTPEPERSRTYGFVFEKVISSKGLSGIQFQFAGGYTPVSLEGQALPNLRFQRYSVFGNKTFLNKRNVERLNLIGGVSFLRDNYLLDSPEPTHSRGYGFFFETNWIPVRRLGVVTRFDQLRSTTLFADNTIRAETASVIYDFTKYTRMLFEYQHRERSSPTNLYRIGWELNF
jgi:nitric oxide reductase subunit C